MLSARRSTLDILLVDDESSILLPFDEALRAEGHRVVTATDGLSASATLASRVFDVIICDVRLPKMDGLTLFRKARQHSPTTQCILMTAYATVGDAVAALKDGAVDYLAKPFDIDDLLDRLSRIAQERELAGQLVGARAEGLGAEASKGVIGRSPAMARLSDRIEKFAASDAPVLITGQSGTGKELVAQALHARSARRQHPLVAVNCAAFPETLLEAELFGHERGAFTGAVKKRDGRFKAAEGGTLFLDEVAEIPLPSQSKLLRVLQEGTYEPLGTNHTETTNARVISATHRNLKELVDQKLFREDLYYRLKILEIPVPPLRERGGDLILLVELFLRRFSAGAKPPSISARALAALAHYSFPGNVRELEHAIHQAVVLAQGDEVDLQHLPAEIAGDPSAEEGDEAPRSLSEVVREFEREYLCRVLKQTSGKRANAARILGISRKNLWEKLRGYGLTESDLEPDPSKKDTKEG
jgi:DNA-binding NtrC family response regulator